MPRLFSKQTRRVWLLAVAFCYLTTGCGVGLLPLPTLSLSLAPQLRPQDCVPVVIGALDGKGNQKAVTASVQLSTTPASSNRFYTSLSGCQTYDASLESSVYFLSPQSPTATAYLRCDDTELTSLKVSARSLNSELDGSEATVPVLFDSFNKARGPNSSIEAVGAADNGKTYIAGAFTAFDQTATPYLARVNTDGSLDPSFAQTGTGLNGLVYSLDVQSDGKLLVGGSFSSYNSAATPYIARLNVDGSLDSSFAGTGTGLNNEVFSLAVQSDGKVLVGGFFTSYNGTSRPYVARLNADGSLDSSFAQTGTGFGSSVTSLVIQSDGKVLVGGNFTSYDSTSRPYFARLNADGSLDPSFAQTGTGLNGRVDSIAVQSDGKVLVGGFFTSYNGTSTPRLTRLNADGSLDSSFVQTGTGLNSRVNSVAVQSDGKVLVGGNFVSYNGTSTPRLARLNADGSMDSSFAQSGTGLDNFVNSLTVQIDGKVLVGGGFTSYNGTSRSYIARLNSDGSLDSSFAQMATGLSARVYSIAIQGNGKLLVGGGFTSYNGTAVRGIARLNADGSLDSSFEQTGTGLNTSAVYSLTVQSDGKVLVGGNFSSYNGTSRPRIARLNADGSLDSSFAPTGTGLNGLVNSVVLQSDGKVLVGGNFTSYNGTSTPRMARLNADGSLDSSFAQTGVGLNNEVFSLAVQSDGKILVGGSFNSYNVTSAPRVARLNADGSFDSSFAQTGTGLSGWVQSLAIQSDGKVMVGGGFTFYNGTSTPRIARLNADGSFDSSFAQTGTGLDGVVYSVVVQSDGKVLVGGEFWSYSGTSTPRVARWNADGSLDVSFSQTGVGLNGRVQSLVIQSDGKVLVGGDVTRYDTTTIGYILRLTYSGLLD
jgi:uncharacterized delta-60 repeat protein